VDTCNLSAANTHYTHYDNRWPTVTEIWRSACNLSTANKPFYSHDNLGSTARPRFPYHDSLINYRNKLAQPVQSSSDRYGSFVRSAYVILACTSIRREYARSCFGEPIPISCSTDNDPWSLRRSRYQSAPRLLQIPDNRVAFIRFKYSGFDYLLLGFFFWCLLMV